MKKIYFLLLALLGASVALSIYLFTHLLAGYDTRALHIANILLIILNLISYFIIRKKLRQERAQAFVNGVYSSTLLRLMICMTSIFVYAFATKDHLHKPTIFMMMGLYILYTLLETIALSKLAKK